MRKLILMTPCSIFGIKAVRSVAKSYATSMERWSKAGLSQITYMQEMSSMNRVVTCNTRAIWYTAAMGVAKLPGLLMMFFCLEFELVPKIRLAFFLPRKLRWVWGFLLNNFRLYFKYNEPSIKINNYWPKCRWLLVDIYQDVKQWGKYPPLTTDTEVNSCFSIY